MQKGIQIGWNEMGRLKIKFRLAKKIMNHSDRYTEGAIIAAGLLLTRRCDYETLHDTANHTYCFKRKTKFKTIVHP